jgi:hypothetical protein
MPYLTNYHIGGQSAHALLGPVNATLAELERRTEHYVTRLAMEPDDRAVVQAAVRVLAAAHQEVERLWRESESARPGARDVRGVGDPGAGGRA